MTSNKIVNGRLILQEIPFNHILTRNVIKNDTKGRQGKISLPKELINKTVYVVVKLDEGAG